METLKEKMNIDVQPFYEVSNNLSTIKSLLIFLDLGINGEVLIENRDLSNIAILLKQLTENTTTAFEKIETDLRI